MGLWGSIKKGVKKVWKKVKNTIKKAIRIVKEIVHRVLGVLDFIGSLLGIRPTKYIRVKVYILTDLKRRPIQGLAEVERWVEETARIFKNRMNVKMQSPDARAGQPIVATIQEPAPAEAVYPGCDLSDAFSDAADYYEDHYDYVHTSTWSYIADALGYGEPIYGFVVANIAEGTRDGCSQPWLHNLVLVDDEPKTTTLAHEIGHVCSLAHKGKPQNLMNPNRDDMDSKLTRWQIAVFRNSRYVTFFRP